jgi:hypothetical protein
VNANGQSNIATVTITINSPTTVQPPTNLRVDSIETRAGMAGYVVTVRMDPPPGPPPNEYALAGGTEPGETLVFVPTGSPYPIFTFNAPPGSFFIRMHASDGTRWSAPSNEVPLHVNTSVTPSAPVNLLGLVNGSAVTLAWTNTFDGGFPTFAQLEVNNVTVPLGLTEGFSRIEVPFGTYDVSIRLANTEGPSPPSNRVTLTVPAPCSGPPDPVEDFLLHVNRSELGAIWALPARGPAPTGYVLDVRSPIFTGSVPLATTSIQARVVPGVYTVSVQATNACGSSAPTPTQTVVVQ